MASQYIERTRGIITEIRKDIKGYEGLYQISNLGRVKSFHKSNSIIDKYGYLSLGKLKNGYMIVCLKNNKKQKTYLVHRLVAQAFMGFNIGNKLDVCHKDDVRDNNYVENLFVGTRKDNMQDCKTKGRLNTNVDGLSKFHIGINNPSSKLSEKEVIQIYNSDLDIDKLAKLFYVSPNTIKNIKNKKTRKHILYSL